MKVDELLKYTQFGINKVLNTSIKMDGFYGTETAGMEPKFISFLIDKFIKKGYIWNDAGNLIGIRLDDTYTNGFTDIGVITKGREFVAFPMSTKPGIGKVLNPPTVAGVKGVAVMKEGQYIDLYQFNGPWWSGMPFMLQTGPVVAYRDSDLNTTITRTVEQSDKDLGYRFSLNFHSYKNSLWSWNLDVLSYLKPDKSYSNLSEGCQVVKKSVMDLLVPHLREISSNGLVTYTLLNLLHD